MILIHFLNVRKWKCILNEKGTLHIKYLKNFMLEYLVVKKMNWECRGHLNFFLYQCQQVIQPWGHLKLVLSPFIRPISFIEDDVWKLLMTQGAKTVSSFQFPAHMMRMSLQRYLFIDFPLLLLVSPSFPRSYLPISGSCCMSCTKQMMMPGCCNCWTLLLKIILSLLAKVYTLQRLFQILQCWVLY